MKKERFRNPYFWLGLGGVIFTAMGVNPEILTSWELVTESIYNLLRNPFMLGSVGVAVLGVVVDPTTKGMKDK